MQYLGDFAEDATVYIPFNTFSSDDPSASVTITDLVDADVKVHKDGSTTEIVTDGATVAVDFDSVTGNHLVTIDTSAHADYSVGSDYLVRIEGTTVDGATVNAWIGQFSIENRTTFPKADFPTNFAAMGIESDGDLTKVNTLDGHTAQTGDNYARLGAPAGASISADIATVDTVVDGIQTDLDNGTDGLGAIKTDTAAILVDTAEIGAAGAGLTEAGGTGDHLTAVPEVSADVTKISGSATAADNLEASALGIISGTAQTGTLSTTVMTSDLSGYLDDELIGRVVVWTSGTAAGQASDITDYASASGTVTYTAITTSPANNDTFVIV